MAQIPTAPADRAREPGILQTSGQIDRSAAYVLEPGDLVDVTFRFTPEFNDEVAIGPDGRAFFKSAGDIKAAGLTVSELKAQIVDGSRQRLVDPEVVVSLKDFDRPHVIVAGEVNTPGRQDLRRPTTVLQAILASGGPKEDAALSRVLLFRRIDSATAEVHILRLNDYSQRALQRNDLLLQPGDMILLRRDLPSRIDRYVKLVNLGLYLNPLQNVNLF